MRPLLTCLLLLASASALAAEPLYKCKTADDVTVYSDYPCAATANPGKPITVKENTVDQSSLRNSKLYNDALPKPISNEGSAASVKVIELEKGAGYKQIPETENSSGSSYGGSPATTTQPWPAPSSRN